jgi:hypothetical protein
LSERPRVEVLREYLDYHAELLKFNPSMHENIKAREAAENRYRWSVKLDCGCTTEALTYGEEHPPTDGPFIKVLGDKNTGHAIHRTFVIDAGSRMLGMTPGYLWCSGHGSPEHPWQQITKWVRSHKGYSSDSKREYAAWTVILSCGHVDSAIITEADWRPEHGHKPNPELAERGRRMLARKNCPDATRSWCEPRVADGYPEPDTGQNCSSCDYLRRIIPFEPIGPLTWPGDRERPSRATLTRRLNAAERETMELEEKLARVKARAAEIREERGKAR